MDFVIRILLRNPPHCIDLLPFDVGFRIHTSAATGPRRFHHKSLGSSLLRLN
jgi:hypothetical protein